MAVSDGFTALMPGKKPVSTTPARLVLDLDRAQPTGIEQFRADWTRGIREGEVKGCDGPLRFLCRSSPRCR
ncbi:hypothetical protein [Streptomyces sp. NPDC058622]|uniref:hypothetical protein n=1 Tax=Streptomyces sp. NPDC058622 TaxID=3346562 RepID=UPI0036531135